MKELNEIKNIIEQNLENGLDNKYEGLSSAEIGRYNLSLMFSDEESFAENYEEFKMVTE